MGSARTLLAHRGIARCEGSWALSAAGTWIFTIALSLYAYYEHGPGGVGLSIAVRMLPAAALAGLPALAGRRLPHRTIVIASATGRGLAVAASALIVWSDAPFVLLLVCAAGFEVTGALHRSIRSSLLLQNARGPERLAALGASRLVTSVGFLVGAGASAALLSTVSFQVTFAAAALVFGIVAVLAGGLASAGRSPDGAAGPAPAWVPVRAAIGQPATKLRVGLFGATVLVAATLDLVLVVVALEIVHLGDGGVGALRAALAAGGLAVAALSVGRLRAGRLAGGLLAGLALTGLPLVLVVAWPTVVSAIVLVSLVGAGYALAEYSLDLLTQRLVALVVAPEVVSIERYVYPLAGAIGGGVGAWLFLGLGDRAAVVVSGLLLPAVAVILARPVIRTERALKIPSGAIELIGQVPLFSALPISALENLALSSRRERFEPGSIIQHRHEQPTHVYVIDEGTAEAVREPGARIRLGRGECVGEAAILDRQLATSDVVATTPLTAWTFTPAEVLGALGALATGASALGTTARPPLARPPMAVG